MKGVSTLVVMILLVLISVSLVGFVFIFLQKSGTSAAGSAQQQQEQLQQSILKQLRIDNAFDTAITVRHAGTEPITLATEVVAYKAGTPVTCTWSVATLQPGELATCTLASPCTGSEIKLTYPAGEATEDCL